jgi:hypothetical protein
VVGSKLISYCVTSANLFHISDPVQVTLAAFWDLGIFFSFKVSTSEHRLLPFIFSPPKIDLPPPQSGVLVYATSFV